MTAGGLGIQDALQLEGLLWHAIGTGDMERNRHRGHRHPEAGQLPDQPAKARQHLAGVRARLHDFVHQTAFF